MEKLKIRNIKTIMTAPEGINLVVVKVETTEPEIYGVGCATFTQRHLSVHSAIEQYLKPFLIGKDVQSINDIWHSSLVSGYWRNGPIMNNALSGVDMALWDIKGKLAGMPLYELFGGKVREGAAVYRHADGLDFKQVEESARSYIEQGYRYIRCQLGTYGGKDQLIVAPEGAPAGAYYDPKAYMKSVLGLFEHLRSELGPDVELLHDIHERLAPIDAVNFAKQLEPYQLFFLEDALPPEQLEWFRLIRQHSTIPLAMGELFNNPNEWMPLVTNRLIDYIRIHISQIGGITPARKLTSLCEAFGVRTAWHGPGDTSPVGHAAHVHLDVSSINFGIQEWNGFSPALQEVFPGCPEIRNGYVYPNDKPGLGIDVDEKLAAQYPCHNVLPEWTLARLPDGTPTFP
ncbi:MULTISPECIES: enolase C-terminal domain-like protein [unclassified Paenibacillus]|uniref:enolase C-terminal domain-like protein n=1 Tax=unclassified Paenibacillus TaxID=185978 RepID=UPI001C126CD2|nr:MULTISPECIES: enolase C-terminal domain-like protein [unclassified Paenibacillus]MBU5440694.1 starvation-sensing protein RspA [Paenibacillus sp. MSJ-34]CAH0122468.1 D-galactonate dehydratase family member [Paenibacillus sp. CECT 9249]